MTATEVLRRLLDERGVEYEGGERSLRWRDRYGVMIQAFPLANGELGMGVWSCTPEQAIAATLGATDAKPTQVESSGTCEMEYVSDWMSWHCKACGQMSMAPRNPKPRYCKWCGRKVVEPTTNDVDAEVDDG